MVFKHSAQRVGAGVVLGIAAILLWVRGTRPSGVGQTHLLPDGAELALIGATYHAPHRFEWDPSGPWRLFAPVAAREPGVTLTCATPVVPAPEVLWFDLKRSRTHPSLDPLRELDITVTDEHECTVDLTEELVAYPARGSDQLLSLPLARFPRRCHRPTLNVFYWEDGLHRPASYEIANPAYTDPHSWRAEVVPQVRNTPEFRCILSHFATGVLTRHSSGFSARGTVETEANFQMLPGPGSSDRWQAIGMRVSDETGNVFPHDDSDVLADFKRAGTRLHFQGELFGEEPVWKLSVEFARAPESRFLPEERCAFRVPLPGASGSGVMPAPQTVGDASVRCVGLTRAGAGWLARFRMAGLEPGRTLTLLGAADDQGRPVTARPDLHRWSRVRGEDVTEYRVRVPDPGKQHALTFAFAVQKTRLVEFTAAPTRPNDPID